MARVSPSTPPARPRLAAHVLARRHLVGEEERVILHDARTGQLLQLGPREWVLLSAADGTRDVEGIVIAAAREGAHARVPAAQAFFAELHAAGLLGADDAGEDAARFGSTAAATPRGARARPGGARSPRAPAGGAARLQPALRRPRELLPDLRLDPLRSRGGGAGAGIAARRAERGRAPRAGLHAGARDVAVRGLRRGDADGRCAYLEGEGRCSLHAKGGPEAKPLGCRTFPTSFIDDGESVRVSVAVECACVLASVGRPGGAPLLDPRLVTRGGIWTSASMSPGCRTARRWRPARPPPRAEVVCLVAAPRRGCAPARRRRGPLLARRRARGRGPRRGGDRACERPDPLDPAALAPWLAALHGRAARRAREDAAWRSERDLARRATRWIAEATLALAEPDLLAALLLAPVPARVGDRERFYLRAALHGHRLLGALPLSLALRDRAVRLVVARVLPAVVDGEGADDPACAEPIALRGGDAARPRPRRVRRRGGHGRVIARVSSNSERHRLRSCR